MDMHLKANLFDIQTAISEIYSFFEQVPNDSTSIKRT